MYHTLREFEIRFVFDNFHLHLIHGDTVHLGLEFETMLFLKSLPLTLLLLIPLLSTWSKCDAFVISNSNAVVKERDSIVCWRRISSLQHLHPDQAAELEACAYDLMRQATLSTRNSNGINHSQGSVSLTLVKQNQAQCNSLFRPVAWCRRVMATAFHHESNPNDAKP
jgi:hypothetical protein